MILADVNILIYTFRADSQDHARYREWLESVINGPEVYGVAPQVLCSFIRIATHPRMYARPSKLADALAFVRTLHQQPSARLVVPGGNHW